jgi:hypothetical protein
MEAGNQSNLRCSVSTKRSFEKTPRKLYSKILEESKDLEKLNRRINRSNGRNIIKEISVFRKLRPIHETPEEYRFSSFQTSDLKRKIALNPQKTSKITDSLSKSNQKKKGYFDVEFKDYVWPEDSIIDDQLFELMTSEDYSLHNPISVDIKPRLNNFQIKSRIGQLERIPKQSRKATSRIQRRVKIRSSSPWEFTGDSRSIVATPFE